MSAKVQPGWRWQLASFLAAACCLPGVVGAFDAVVIHDAPFQDPLQAVPEVIRRGSILPGDGSPLVCSEYKDFTIPLDLAEAVDLALCNNAQLKASWAAIKIQAAALGEARAAYLPTLSGTASRLNDQTRYPGSDMEANSANSHSLYGSLSWRLLDFGGRGANHEAATRGLDAALASHDANLQKTLAGVIQAYFDAQSTRAAWQAKLENEDIARHTLETAKRREAGGAGARSDSLQSATALARAGLDKQRAHGAYQKALSVLVYVVGVPAETRVMLAADREEHPDQSIMALSAWLEATRKQHPAIQAVQAQLQAARQRLLSSRSDGLPSMDFTANYFENGRPGQGLTANRTQERTVGVTLNIPLFDGFSRSYKIRGAEAQVEQKGAELQDTERQILMEVVKAHADASAALGNLQASEDLLNAARASLAVSLRKFERGAADILEILSTQAARADAAQERIRSQAEWRSARLRLLAAAGRMGRGHSVFPVFRFAPTNAGCDAQESSGLFRQAWAVHPDSGPAQASQPRW